MAVLGALSGLVVLLSVAVHNHPFASQDIRLNDWIVGWSFPGLDGILTGVEYITSDVAAGTMGLLAVVFLFLSGRTRLALAVVFFGGVLGLMATIGEHSLGDLIGRVGPEAGSSAPSFPSGHAFGSVVFFGFIGFLGVYYRLSKRILIPLLLLTGALIILSGPARIHVQGHWPSDAAAGYLLGFIWLMVLIPLFLRIRRVPWLSSQVP